MGKLKVWLRGANGWKRLWFALAVLGLFYALLINPFVVTEDTQGFRNQYRWAVAREFENAECQPYAKKPIEELSEPEYKDSEGRQGCYHIYNYRKFHNPTKAPYTLEDLENDYVWETLSEIFFWSGFGALTCH